MRPYAILGLLVAAAMPGLAAMPSASAKAVIQREVASVVANRKQTWNGGRNRRGRGGREGWTVAEGQRRAIKRRNQLRHKARVRR